MVRGGTPTLLVQLISTTNERPGAARASGRVSGASRYFQQ
jgi:hypothetical protein